MTPESQNGRSHRHHAHHPQNNHHGAAGGSRRPQQDFAQINDWEMHRDRITELYRDQGLHLKQVQKIMAEEHQFFASQRMYKTRISKWAIDKNLKAADVATLLRLQQQRAALGKKSRFTVRGRDIDFARVDQYLKRDPTLLKRSQQGQHGEDQMGDILPDHMEAAGITCRTPSPTPPPSPSPPAPYPNHQQRQDHQDHFYGHQLPHHPYHQHHNSNPYSHHHNHFSLPSTTVPIVPSHTPMAMVTTPSTFPTMTSTLSSAPFTTTHASTTPSLSLPTATLPYMPLHTAHSVSSFNNYQHRTFPSQHAAYDARRNSIANPSTFLSSIPQNSLPTFSPYTSSFPQPAILFESSSPVNEATIQDDLVRVTREYVIQAFQQGMWVPHGSTFVSTKATNQASGGTAADRRLVADGMLDEGFDSVHHTMDNLHQHLQDEDPSLLFCLLYSTAFGTKCPLNFPRSGRDSAAELRQTSVSLGRHVRSLTHIVLGEQHPITRLMRLLVADDGRLRSPAHMAALPVPLAAMRDLVAERDPAGVDPAGTAQCQRLASLLRVDRATTQHASAVDAERDELMARLQGTSNLHTKLQFFTTYMAFLSELALQQEEKRKAEVDAAAVHVWSGGDIDIGVAVTAAGLSTLTPAYSSASETPESAYTTATVTVAADNDAYRHSKPAVIPVLTGVHGHTHGHTPVSNMNSPLSAASSASSLASSPPSHALPVTDVSSSAMIPQPATPMTTPRSILAGQHHNQQHGHSSYTTQPSAYPPVPTTFHHHSGLAATGMTLAAGHEATLVAHSLTGQHQGGNPHMTASSMNDPGPMTWEMGDAADVNWM